MGDIEGYRRKKSIQKIRDPKLTDQENFELHRLYLGNPFIAPGTLGSKSKKNNQNQNIVPSDETFIGT